MNKQLTDADPVPGYVTVSNSTDSVMIYDANFQNMVIDNSGMIMHRDGLATYSALPIDDFYYVSGKESLRIRETKLFKLLVKE